MDAAAAAAAAAAADALRQSDASSIVASDSSHTQAQQRADNDERHTSFSSFRAPSTVTLDPEDYTGWAVQMEGLLELGEMWPLRAPGAPGETAHTRRRMLEAWVMLSSALRDKETRRVLTGLPPRDPLALWNALKRRFTHMCWNSNRICSCSFKLRRLWHAVSASASLRLQLPALALSVSHQDTHTLCLTRTHTARPCRCSSLPR